MATKPVILVFGATGKQGSAVIPQLSQILAQSHAIRIVTRNPAGAKAAAFADTGIQVHKGDMLDPQSLSDAMQGVWGVYLVTDNMGKGGVVTEQNQAKNVIEQAVRAGVQYFVYCSSFGVSCENDTANSVPHFTSKRAIEHLITSASWPLGYAILRPGSFFENFEVMGPLSRGSLSGITPGAVKLKWISTKDIGVFAALAFQKPEVFKGNKTEIVGDWISPDEMAKVLSDLTDSPWTYSEMPHFLLRLLSKDLYLMSVALDKLDMVETDIPSLRSLHPTLQSFQDWCVAKGIGEKDSSADSYVYAKSLWQKLMG
ncbi:NAD(P)-binding protein [Gonapodya prolifera JEL478]|uniref:NAD(P)-binding protein n=1 Tax=Gonapodya prolifera (strain JEL478) TaxID=1344416 RepID=A0A139A1E9_GONPJ|nr:NAD(P)-binding protein [Gonapodya prolifera JEL478]|eukprot:KXS10559.1 NAD(P)-binding protein [Gonapodya prolifera JEL478]